MYTASRNRLSGQVECRVKKIMYKATAQQQRTLENTRPVFFSRADDKSFRHILDFEVLVRVPAWFRPHQRKHPHVPKWYHPLLMIYNRVVLKIFMQWCDLVRLESTTHLLSFCRNGLLQSIHLLAVLYNVSKLLHFICVTFQSSHTRKRRFFSTFA